MSSTPSKDYDTTRRWVRVCCEVDREMDALLRWEPSDSQRFLLGGLRIRCVAFKRRAENEQFFDTATYLQHVINDIDERLMS